VKYGRDHSELYNWHPVHSLLHFQVQSGIIAERKIHYYIITEKKRSIFSKKKSDEDICIIVSSASYHCVCFPWSSLTICKNANTITIKNWSDKGFNVLEDLI
jgi:hypothetical protein